MCSHGDDATPRPIHVQKGVVVMVAVGALIGGIDLILVSGLLYGIAGQLENGKFSRNNAIGIRTKQTKLSDAGWEAGHKKAAPIQRRVGFVGVVLGILMVVLAFVARNLTALNVVVGVASYVWLILGMIWVAVAADRAAGEANRAAAGGEQLG
ncbi:hypothetical protein DLJ54_01315 [Corynebacterium heidelbergense]|uniref:SdpI family protein n=1 Tax=Corynebacterium heidelbergense TaxID=2055947 RepID=A0A364V8B4_9CORY|nr:hypothetical protein DLJ54_01315 [Corynebacterium heidelbergense]